MALDFAADLLAELTHYQKLGVDGVFVDCPSTARKWRLATGQLSVQPTSWVGTVISGPGKPFWHRPNPIMPFFSSIGAVSQVALNPVQLADTRFISWHPDLSVACMHMHAVRKRTPFP